MEFSACWRSLSLKRGWHFDPSSPAQLSQLCYVGLHSLVQEVLACKLQIKSVIYLLERAFAFVKDACVPPWQEGQVPLDTMTFAISPNLLEFPYTSAWIPWATDATWSPWSVEEVWAVLAGQQRRISVTDCQDRDGKQAQSSLPCYVLQIL